MDKDLFSQLERMFAALNNQSAADSLPQPGTLSDLLAKHVHGTSSTITVPAEQKLMTCFGTAAVEMWLRSLHSFLISVSLTKASPIWASVAGYYSSHYSVRAFAHLFGVYSLHKRRRIVHLEKTGDHFFFRIEKKQRNGGEHKFYWKYVSEHPQLASDPFFYPNEDDATNQSDALISDSAHRNKANYSDHIDRFPVFLPLEPELLNSRVEHISKIFFSSVPVPNANKFPDTDNVQIVAYHRLVKFRRFVDDTVGTKNRFWSVQRNPSWWPSSVKFRVEEPVYTAFYAGK